jgi:hypothetical protein
MLSILMLYISQKDRLVAAIWTKLLHAKTNQMKKILLIYVLMLAITWTICYFTGVFDLYIGTPIAAIIAATLTVGVKYGYFFLAMIIGSRLEDLRFSREYRKQAAR